MWLRLRQAAVIAVVLLASILLSQDTATSSGAPAKAPTTQVRRHAGAGAAKTARPAQPQPFTFADVQKLAQERAAHDYRPMPDALPAALANLSYDQFRDIRFRPESECRGIDRSSDWRAPPVTHPTWADNRAPRALARAFAHRRK